MTSLRGRRLALDMTQAELARRSGLSRQLVGAVEAGRHSPSVTAALALAAALDCRVEDLFAPQEERAKPVGGGVPEGAPVAACRVGDGLSYAALPERGAWGSSWHAADGVVRGDGVDLFPGATGAGVAVAGCDPALGLAAELLPRRGPERLAVFHASSGAALEALRAGQVHAALVHGRAEDLEPPRGMASWRIAAWEVGLAARPGTALDLGGLGGARIARREKRAAAQQALERALARTGRRGPLQGPVASGHLDAVRRVVYGGVDAAVTMRAAALAYGLAFRPLEHHVVELRIEPRWMSEPGVRALGDLLASRAWRARLASVGGYELPA